MEYYILKLYQSEKQKCPDVEHGFGKYEPKTKAAIIICFIVMIVSYIEMLLTILLFPKQFWYIFGVAAVLVTMAWITFIDSKDQKKHMDKYVDSHIKKIQILKKLLKKEFGIKNKYKVQELINIYQDYLNMEAEKEKKRNRMFAAVLSGISGVLAMSFEIWTL